MKKALSLALLLVIVFSLLSPSLANYQNLNSTMPQFMIDFITPLYTLDSSGYKVLDSSGNDVTDIFILNTNSLYSQHKWDEIHSYMINNSYTVVKFEELDTQTRSSDIAVRVTAGVAKYIKCQDPDRPAVFQADATLSGNIYYNPNTGVVSNVGGTQVTNFFTTQVSGVFNSFKRSALNLYEYHDTYKGYFGVSFTATTDYVDMDNNSRTIKLEISAYPE